jgi:hypothetical protein
LHIPKTHDVEPPAANICPYRTLIETLTILDQLAACPG